MRRIKRICVLELEGMLEQGCATPGCDCGGVKLPELYLHPKCHPMAGTVIQIARNEHTLTVSCAQCSKLVVDVRLSLATIMRVRAREGQSICSCPDVKEANFQGFDVCYKQGSGQLTVTCRGCKALVDNFEVALLT